MSVTLRPMQEQDIAEGFALSHQMKWPHRREDWLQAWQHGKGMVALEGDTVIGTVLCWPWGGQLAMVGLVIVDERLQGKGIGKALMSAILSQLEGCNVRLHATEMGKGLYEKYGFTAIGMIHQHQTPFLPVLQARTLPPGWHIRPATENDLPAITALDKAANGMYRPQLFADLLVSGSPEVLTDATGTIQAVAVKRHFGRGYAIGPILGYQEERVCDLVAHQFSRLAGEFVRVDCDASLPFSKWLTGCGLAVVDAPVLMVRGTPWQPEPGGPQTFGLMTQAMG